MSNMILFTPGFRKDSNLACQIEPMAKARNLDFEVVYVTKSPNPLQQQQFLYAVHVADIVIVDCTIPNDVNDGGVYPALTAQINMLPHVIVVSETCLPLNITPYRGVYPTKDGESKTIAEIIDELPRVIDASIKEDTYARLPEDIYKDFTKYQEDMENMLNDAFDVKRKKTKTKTPIMISYRNSHSKEVEEFKKIIEGDSEVCREKRGKMGLRDNYEIKVLPPASLCGADEAHTPMRRWMLVGLLEDHIREVEEVWVYESHDEKGKIDYTKSWWTMAEMVMVASLNKSIGKRIKVRAFYKASDFDWKFYETTPSKYLATINEKQSGRLARYLSNTRPDTMGPECIDNVRQLRQIADLMRISPESIKRKMLENLRVTLEQSVPKTIGADERKKMIEGMIDMYSDPEKIEEYANDDVFQQDFWEKISYQISDETACFVNDENGGHIDVDKFMSIPMKEVTDLTIHDFENAANSKDGKINLGSSSSSIYYKVEKAKYDRYLWLATRMGRATIKEGNAPGLERIPIYNITTYK